VPSASPSVAADDVLTGLPGRQAWEHELSAALRDDAEPISVALLEVDELDAYHDRNGRTAADRLLQRVSAAWRGTLRADDLIARYDNEVFAVLLHDCDAVAGLTVAERLRRTMPKGESASIALAQWDGVEDEESLVARADAGLCRAKYAGRNRAVLAS
jgi:diguanylate cyclase (GGDEF)-like protein